MFTYHLTQCKRVEILPCLWGGGLLSALDLFILYVLVSRLSFWSLHSCVYFLQMMKYSCQVCQLYIIVNHLQAALFNRSSHFQKHLKFFPQLINMDSISINIRGLVKLQHKFSTDVYPFQNNILVSVDMSSIYLPIVLSERQELNYFLKIRAEQPENNDFAGLFTFAFFKKKQNLSY